ncbi:MAG: glycoside hydrolase family 57, partial [Pseudomonadota bacterium]
MSRLDLYAFFHVNIHFSSIEEERRRDLLDACYWPLLDFVQSAPGPIGIEATSSTLSELAALDPAWLETFKSLIASQDAYVIGSGFAQIIGPLAPAAVNRQNLQVGAADYTRLLGSDPALYLVNEQAISRGLVDLYAEHKVGGLLTD